MKTISKQQLNTNPHTYFELHRFGTNAVLKKKNRGTDEHSYVAKVFLREFSDTPLSSMALTRNFNMEACALRIF